MSDEVDYNSESDEDFCPDKAGGGSASEEEDSGDEEEACGAEADTQKHTEQATKRRKRVGKKATKSKKTKKASSDEDDGESVKTRTISTRQSGANGDGRSTKEKTELESDDEDPSRVDALWADFLSDVQPAGSTKTSQPKKEPTKATTNGKATSTTKDTKKEVVKSDDVTKDIKESKKDSSEEDKKVKVTEILDFAGEAVVVEKMVSASSLKAKKSAVPVDSKSPVAGVPLKRGFNGAGPPMRSSTGGLSSILNQLGKKKKMSVLEKTQMDWTSFKQDEGIDEQLQTFNKGKDGYLERQDFLQRTDLRQFEIEKSLRQTKRTN